MKIQVTKLRTFPDFKKKTEPLTKRVYEVTDWVESILKQIQEHKKDFIEGSRKHPLCGVMTALLEASINLENTDCATKLLRWGADPSRAWQKIKNAKEGASFNSPSMQADQDTEHLTTASLVENEAAAGKSFVSAFLVNLESVLLDSKGNGNFGKSSSDTELPETDPSWLCTSVRDPCRYAPKCYHGLSCRFVHIHRRLPTRSDSQPQVLDGSPFPMTEEQFTCCAEPLRRMVGEREWWTARYRNLNKGRNIAREIFFSEGGEEHVKGGISWYTTKDQAISALKNSIKVHREHQSVVRPRPRPSHRPSR